MARWLLDNPHIIGEAHLPAGTVVGDDTPYAVADPSFDMLPMDRDAFQKTLAMYKTKERGCPGWREPPKEPLEPSPDAAKPSGAKR